MQSEGSVIMMGKDGLVWVRLVLMFLVIMCPVLPVVMMEEKIGLPD